uniref:Leukotriene C4 synthase, gene 2 n=1 Tax=Xenopus tropicalis TaxID=8364 RepID=A0A803KFC8_XENTR
MLHHIVLLGAVTLLGVLEQAYFSLQVIAARRKYGVSPPSTSGPPEFDRVFRAQVNCTEYFPMFLAVLWLAGIFFHQGTASVCGLLYLLARYRYFQGYSASPKESKFHSYFLCSTKDKCIPRPYTEGTSILKLIDLQARRLIGKAQRTVVMARVKQETWTRNQELTFRAVSSYWKTAWRPC